MSLREFVRAQLEQFDKFLRRRAASKKRERERRTPLRLEQLEDRLAPAGLDWIPLGPSPQQNPQGLNGEGGPAEVSSGRVTSLAFGTYQNQTVLYAGTASGGV